jgi:hypothetical protein
MAIVLLVLLCQVSSLYPLFSKSETQRTVNDTSPIPFDQATLPRTILFNPKLLAEAKAHPSLNNNESPQVSNRLILEANSFLGEKAKSVMDKSRTPPSGDKHDFLSLTPYLWPDPSKPDGLPYVFHDGKINPEVYLISDKRNLDDMIYRVKTLALAYYFTNNQTYAAKATELLRVWFLDNSTRMNPNLRYAEIITGKDKVNPSGIMAATYISDILDAVALLQDSNSWTEEDQRGIELWFSNYLDWLLHSEGVEEENRKINNHGTYYDVQVASISLFLNKTDITKKVLTAATQELSPVTLADIPKLIAVKIQPDGRQPFELQRTKALDYSMFNLLGLFKLAGIGEHVGIDLWNYKTQQGAGLKKALDYVLPFALKEKTWLYQQIKPMRNEYLVDLLCQATIHYPNDTSYLQAYKSLNKEKIRTDLDNYPVCLAPFNLIRETDPGSIDADNSE